MSKKRMMSKQQRLYYEYSRKERVREELIEYFKLAVEFERSYNQFPAKNHFS